MENYSTNFFLRTDPPLFKNKRWRIWELTTSAKARSYAKKESALTGTLRAIAGPKPL